MGAVNPSEGAKPGWGGGSRGGLRQVGGESWRPCAPQAPAHVALAVAGEKGLERRWAGGGSPPGGFSVPACPLV